MLGVLRSVIDPDLNRDIVTLGFVQELTLDESSRKVSFNVELTTPACPVKESFRTQCEELVSNLSWTAEVEVTMTAQDPTNNNSNSDSNTPFGLSAVSSIIAVSSCKGGVGKSTTAVNLAYALQSLGATVGILDADVYGPSLPTMITPDDDNVQFVGRSIAPLQRNGVKLMSFGYVNEDAAIMRGPMVTQLLDQFMSLIDWGQLDYLILDMPPGTGDIQLTLSQRLNITAAVIVTTPQELSFVDVARGVDMFQETNVPCVAVVENMAYLLLEDDHQDKPTTPTQQSMDYTQLQEAFVSQIQSTLSPLDKDSVQDLANNLVSIVQQQKPDNTNNYKNTPIRIFGAGHKDRLAKQWGIEHTFSMPLLQNIASTGDSGTPFFLQHKESEQAKLYTQLAKSVVQEVAKIQFAKSQGKGTPIINYDADTHSITVLDDHHSTATTTMNDENDTTTSDTISPAQLRRECKCAACVEELTGRQLLLPMSVPDYIKPNAMAPCGNYALSVDWSDGHRSLYPYKQIRSIIREQQTNQKEDVAEMKTNMGAVSA